MSEINIKFRQEDGELRIMISSENLLITTYGKNLEDLKKNLKEAIESTVESIKKENNSIIDLKNLFKIFNFGNLNSKINAIKI